MGYGGLPWTGTGRRAERLRDNTVHQHSAVSPAFGRGGVDEAAEYSRADAAVDGDGGGGTMQTGPMDRDGLGLSPRQPLTFIHDEMMDSPKQMATKYLPHH